MTSPECSGVVPKISIEELTVRTEGDRSELHLDEAAGRYFGCERNLHVFAVERLGPVIASPGPRMRLGKWLSRQASEQARDGFWGLSLDDGRWIDAVALDGDVKMFLDGSARPSPGAGTHSTLVHGMRNQLNAIQMNAEVLQMLAEARGDNQIGEAVERVLKNARLLRETLDESVQDDRMATMEICDLVQALRSKLSRRYGSRIILDQQMQILVSRDYCSSIFDLMTQWVDFARTSEDEPVRLMVDSEAEAISIEMAGVDPWVAHYLTTMPDWLRGSDVSSVPTRAFRGLGLGCGYWRDGRAAGADLGYRPQSR